MIYDITLHTKVSNKRLYLTAENTSALYKRCLDMYRVLKDDVTINDVINDEDININNKKPATIPITREYSERAKEIVMGTIRGLSQDDISARVSKGFKLVETSLTLEDIDVILNKYKIVKVYYRRTGAKKNKEYIALVK